MMNGRRTVSVIGLGHVGLVQAACLAADGHLVIGVDRNQVRLLAIAEAKCPVPEPGLTTIVERAVHAGNLRTTRTVASAVRDSEITLICVGTPTTASGVVDLTDLMDCVNEVRCALSAKQQPHTVIVRSTIPVGTMRERILPLFPSDLAPANGAPVTCLFVPEFLREGHAIDDYRHPQKIVVGCDADHVEVGAIINSIFNWPDAPRHIGDCEFAEMIKYADNYWHALKVCFANEIYGVSSKFGVDGTQVMRLLCEDRLLNISDAYLKPGMPFGGSCLPKDVAALCQMASEQSLDLPLLNAVAPSNQRHLERCVSQILESGEQKIGIWGLAFKPGTGDLRNSPSLAVIEKLLAMGKILSLYDEQIGIAEFTIALANHYPACMSAVEDGRIQLVGLPALKECDLIVLCHGPQELLFPRRQGQKIVDICSGKAVISSHDPAARHSAP